MGDIPIGGTETDTLLLTKAVTLSNSFSVSGVENINMNGFSLSVKTMALVDLSSLTSTGPSSAIQGGAGSDGLRGGFGMDSLYDGSNHKSDGAADTFVFDTAPGAGNDDVIVGFEANVRDKMALDPAIFSAIGPALDVNEFASINSATVTASTATQRILFSTVTGSLFYDADGSGITWRFQA